jgi:hypothetical protein
MQLAKKEVPWAFVLKALRDKGFEVLSRKVDGVVEVGVRIPGTKEGLFAPIPLEESEYEQFVLFIVAKVQSAWLGAK